MTSLPESNYTVTYSNTTDSSTAGISQPVYYYANTSDPWTQNYYPLFPGQVVPISSPKDYYALPKLEEPFDEEAELLAEDF